MTADSPLKLTAPAFDLLPNSEAEAFGAAAWLWMHSPNHWNLPLRAMARLLQPPIGLQQYVLASQEQAGMVQPVAYLAWANLSAEAESRYLANPVLALQPQDWNSGDRMWCVDWFSPFGHAAEFARALHPLFARSCARHLHHRGNERGMRVRMFRGANVSSEAARQWWQQRPMLACTALSEFGSPCIERPGA